MISYITVGTNNLEQARVFFDGLLSEYNISRLHDDERFSFYSDGVNPGVMLTKPYDEKPATVGNGNMIAFSAESNEQADAVYRKALSLGASCEGELGLRGGGMTYGAYFRDLDGNKFAVMCLQPS